MEKQTFLNSWKTGKYSNMLIDSDADTTGTYWEPMPNSKEIDYRDLFFMKGVINKSTDDTCEDYYG